MVLCRSILFYLSLRTFLELHRWVQLFFTLIFYQKVLYDSI